ncbi:S-adenosyl-L-methionine-dependent methyltransferase [Hypoxylon trugodes]|uniref:S-adenosyl-L-methionine-dependent methyltransferase n=1 Tax=Hypoxylon trugodes TaxID=326681 RepID=UPI00218DB27E|nr:S-adenosyl-L-methionine-dependent methyltransferase [Hypoxylon trugodes]KAI1382977.1 S-adenosyl-L-methionine-dependent methyltransferase [Hypoxylon trugodes]
MAGIEGLDLTIESLRLPDFNPPGIEVDDDYDPGDHSVKITQVDTGGKDPTAYHHDRPRRDMEKYYMPIDEAELSRLNKQHNLWTRVLDGDFLKAPVKEPKHVLDVASGTGVWSTEFAKLHPNAQVLGIDITKSAPPEVLPNCKFEERDFTGPWDFPQKFDVVHCRLLFTIPYDPRVLIRKAYDSLAPGGYLEYQENYPFLLDVDGSLKGTFLEQYYLDIALALRSLGNKHSHDVILFKKWMEETGFEDVGEIHRAMPMGGWAKGEYKDIGVKMRDNIEDAFNSLMRHLLGKGLGWSPEEVTKSIQRASETIRDKSVHAYLPAVVVYGRKPLNTS